MPFKLELGNIWKLLLFYYIRKIAAFRVKNNIAPILTDRRFVKFTFSIMHRLEKNVKENVIMYRRIRIFLNLLAQGVLAENIRNSSGGGAYDYRTLNIDRAMT